ncbi:MAG: serine hydrolase, partial [Cyclobacteriaceae bacterium]
PGKSFYYSSRFGLLTRAIASASGKPYDQLIAEQILKPLALQNSFLLEDSTRLSGRNVPVARPYELTDEGIRPGSIEYGYSASAGLVSNPKDLTIFLKALKENQLISANSKARMYDVSGQQPYGYGIFSQTFNDTHIVWAYGQYDCYSSLVLTVPTRNLSVILLANSSLLSDPARLINGDVTKSLFAISFLKNFIFDASEMPILGAGTIDFSHYADRSLYTRKLLATAQSFAYISRYDTSYVHKSAEILNAVFAEYPEDTSLYDLNVLHTLSYLKDVVYYYEMEKLALFDKRIEAIGQRLLQEDPYNPYAHYYLGSYFSRLGETNLARGHFRRITDAPNFSPWWYTREAAEWLRSNEN